MGDKYEEFLLLERIGQGDESALVRLMSEHKESVFRFAYRYLGNQSDSEEVTEETFFRVYQNASRFLPKASAKTWIFSIALNLTQDRLRKRKKFRGEFSFDQIGSPQKSKTPLIEKLDSGERSPALQSQTLDDLQAINSCIERLPEKLRFPFMFCILEDHSYDECAAILKSSRKTVETRIYRARQALKGMLQELHGAISSA